MNVSIVPGTVFGSWTILADAGRGEHGQKQVFVQCKCGTDKIVSFYSIRTDVSTQCMNCRFPTLRFGQKFGKWTVHYQVSKRDNKNYYMCECACGTIEIIRGTILKNGKTGSCQACAQTKHGMKYTSIYNRWASMKQRCMNPNNDLYKYYGGRGIKLCDRWKKFENFLEDMGEPPEGLSLRRIDNDGDYEPENCRWATRIVQAKNKSNNICNRKV